MVQFDENDEKLFQGSKKCPILCGAALRPHHGAAELGLFQFCTV